MISKEELESGLAYFTGSEAYHRLTILPIKATDGVAYLAENAEAYWLVDAIASYQVETPFVNEEFQTWTLRKKSDGKGAILSWSDGNGLELPVQVIEYTDFPLYEIKLYLVNNVLMLPREY